MSDLQILVFFVVMTIVMTGYLALVGRLAR